MILLKYNGLLDESFGFHKNLKLGEVVVLKRLVKFYETFPATVELLINKKKHIIANTLADLNIFDYIPKNSPEYKEAIERITCQK